MENKQYLFRTYCLPEEDETDYCVERLFKHFGRVVGQNKFTGIAEIKIERHENIKLTGNEFEIELCQKGVVRVGGGLDEVGGDYIMYSLFVELRG